MGYKVDLLGDLFGFVRLLYAIVAVVYQVWQEFQVDAIPWGTNGSEKD